MKNSAVLLLFVLLLSEYSCSQKEDKEICEPTEILISPELVVSDVPNPWGMAFLSDGSMLIT